MTQTHKNETRAVKAALAMAGIEARVRQRYDRVCSWVEIGVAYDRVCSWVEIGVADGRLRDPALTVAERVCNRHSFDGIITVVSDN